MKIPFVSLAHQTGVIKMAYQSRLEELLNKSDFVMGPCLSTFEQNYASYTGVQYCVGMSNGLDALKVALRVAGVGVGDEVIVPAHTFIATWLAVSEIGAIPVPVDCQLKTRNIDETLIEQKISNKTKAIIAVHLYGLPCHMKYILDIASEHQLIVIEDNAQAQGAKYKGSMTGSFGHINATSFYPSKNLGVAGDAGAITINVEQYYNHALLLRNYGSIRKYYHEEVGYNARMDNLQAAFLDLKLPHLDTWNAERTSIANTYVKALSGIGDLTLPFTPSGYEPAFHLFVVTTKFRTKLQQYLRQGGIETLIHYPVPNPLQEAYRNLGYANGDFKNTEQLSETVLSLPLYPGIAQEQVEYVVQEVIQFFKEL
ncbi:MAG: DegT/DnrJ/EryC1/StrS family aminotransferase [Bacteroidetes bacterium]|nr:DegT/DnrJ/EryC1/StrS family aminotransferase [Bacteroidota bacterium]